MTALADGFQFSPQAADDALFQPGNVTLGDAQLVGYLFLGVLSLTVQAKDGHIHRTAFRRSGKQRRQPQTGGGCAAQ